MLRAVYQALGIGLVLLAVIGALLPVLPSTPFLLLATGCFMRSSPQWNERLFRSPFFGRTLHDWHTKRIVSPTSKVIALGSMFVVGTTALACGHLSPVLKATLLVAMTIAITVVLRLPSTVRYRHGESCIR